MSVRRLPAWAAVLLLSAGLSAQVFRGNADVVVLNVTVTDALSHFVAGLDRGDFQILEDGALQDITMFAREQQPIALSILLDTSTSMDKKLPIAQEAAIGFAKRLGPKDVAQIIDRKSTRLNSSHSRASRMPSSA